MHSGILSMSRDSLIEKTRSFDFAQDDKMCFIPTNVEGSSEADIFSKEKTRSFDFAQDDKRCVIPTAVEGSFFYHPDQKLLHRQLLLRCSTKLHPCNDAFLAVMPSIAITSLFCHPDQRGGILVLRFSAMLLNQDLSTSLRCAQDDKRCVIPTAVEGSSEADVYSTEKTRSFDFAQDDKSVINQFDKILNNQYTKNLKTNHSNHDNDLISPEQNHEHIYH